jgi:hypothetical protein
MTGGVTPHHHPVWEAVQSPSWSGAQWVGAFGVSRDRSERNRGAVTAQGASRTVPQRTFVQNRGTAESVRNERALAEH